MIGQPSSSPKAANAAASATTRLTGTGSPEGGQSITHDRLVLGMDESCRSGPNHYTGRLKITKQAGGDMLVVEGHDIAPRCKGPHGRRVGVVADRDVMHHRRG